MHWQLASTCTHTCFHHAWGQPMLINSLFFPLSFFWTLPLVLLRVVAMSYGCHCCVWCRLIGVCQGNHQLLPIYPGLLWDKFAVRAAEAWWQNVCVTSTQDKATCSLLLLLEMGSVCDKIKWIWWEALEFLYLMTERDVLDVLISL